MEHYGTTQEEFNHLRLKKVSSLSDSERELMKGIREAVPKPGGNTVFQKTIPVEDIPKYLGENGDAYGYIKFQTNDVDNIEIPFGELLGGSNMDKPPCTLNGFTGAGNGEMIPEWFVKEGTKLKPIEGAELIIL